MELIGDLAAEELHPEGVGHLMSEDIGEHKDLPRHDHEEDNEEKDARGKTAEGLVGQKAVVNGGGEGLKKTLRQD